MLVNKPSKRNRFIPIKITKVIKNNDISNKTFNTEIKLKPILNLYDKYQKKGHRQRNWKSTDFSPNTTNNKDSNSVMTQVTTNDPFQTTNYFFKKRLEDKVNEIVNQVNITKHIKSTKHKTNRYFSPETDTRHTSYIVYHKKSSDLFIDSHLNKIERKQAQISLKKKLILNQKMQHSFLQKTKDYTLEKMTNEPIIVNSTQMNRKIIRDFGIQHKGIQQDIEYSKANMDLAQKYSSMNDLKMKLQTRNLTEIFDKMKTDNDYFPQLKDTNEIEKEIVEEFYHKLNKKEYEKNKKANAQRRQEKIKNKAINYADLVLELGTKNYGKPDHPQPSTSLVEVKYDNLSKKIALYNFKCKKLNSENDGTETVAKLKELKRQQDIKLLLTLKKLGPPQFIKKKFTKKTVELYNGISGSGLDHGFPS